MKITHGISILFFFISFLNPFLSFGQYEQDNARNLIGVGVGTSYIKGSGEFAGSFRMRYMRTFGKNERFSIAPAIGAVFDEDGHVSANLIYGYRPVDYLYLGLGPGVKFSGTGQVLFISYAEIIYEMDFRYFLAGPLFEYGWSPGNKHLMFGIHFGLPF